MTKDKLNNKERYESYPLSPLQGGMLFHSLANIGSDVDVQQIICRAHEKLDVELFVYAWKSVLERHAVLRSQFLWKEESGPKQVIIPEVSLNIKIFDWKNISESDRNKRFEAFAQDDRVKSFDMSEVPLMRLAIFELGSEEYQFIWTFHHILLDGRAFPIILDEIFTFYEAYVDKWEISLEAPRPFKDYVVWVGKRDLSKDEVFWRKNLAGFTYPTCLVVGGPTDAKNRGMGTQGSCEIRIAKETVSELRKMASSHGFSMNTLIEGSWALLLSRYNDEEDIVYGTTRSCRRASIEGAESMIGLLINTVPVRVSIQKQLKLIDWLKELRERHR